MAEGAVLDQEQPTTGDVVEQEGQELVVANKAQLPAPVVRRGISEGQWRMLFNLFPGARPDSALMVWDYCKARNLDPMKKPCHIVQMDVKTAQGWTKRDVVMPGIYEYRITAHRTGLYLGHTKPVYGPVSKIAGVEAPEYCEMTMRRWHAEAKQIIDFPVTAYFSEVVATTREGTANARWTKAPRQMLTKCTEAAGLREAFPEEFGGEATAEEMDGRAIDAEVVRTDAPVAEPQRRSEKAAGAEPAAPTSDVEPHAGSDNGTQAAAHAEPEPSPDKASTATKASAPQQDGPGQVTKHVHISETTYVGKPRDGSAPYWEIKGEEMVNGRPKIGFTWLTRDEQTFQMCASCEGSDSLFTVTWHHAKMAGKAVKVITAIAGS